MHRVSDIGRIERLGNDCLRKIGTKGIADLKQTGSFIWEGGASPQRHRKPHDAAGAGPAERAPWGV